MLQFISIKEFINWAWKYNLEINNFLYMMRTVRIIITQFELFFIHFMLTNQWSIACTLTWEPWGIECQIWYAGHPSPCYSLSLAYPLQQLCEPIKVWSYYPYWNWCIVRLESLPELAYREGRPPTIMSGCKLNHLLFFESSHQLNQAKT